MPNTIIDSKSKINQLEKVMTDLGETLQKNGFFPNDSKEASSESTNSTPPVHDPLKIIYQTFSDMKERHKISKIMNDSMKKREEGIIDDFITSFIKDKTNISLIDKSMREVIRVISEMILIMSYDMMEFPYTITIWKDFICAFYELLDHTSKMTIENIINLIRTMNKLEQIQKEDRVSLDYDGDFLWGFPKIPDIEGDMFNKLFDSIMPFHDDKK